MKQNNVSVSIYKLAMMRWGAIATINMGAKANVAPKRYLDIKKVIRTVTVLRMA